MSLVMIMMTRDVVVIWL